ncbi:hypothetical protein [Burkholderia sp. Tr-20390]|uniref:hypothetical protein n=1 Tax=Burkholderia sp. Tr-20390 TaxID=2703904 RepID=UPI001981D792|nr:hypothetical protein [Burkholderia sp. Tr-20390]MBN3729396.1 hypothetical protein [Burkholderia sp. Tr-20390]
MSSSGSAYRLDIEVDEELWRKFRPAIEGETSQTWTVSVKERDGILHKNVVAFEDLAFPLGMSLRNALEKFGVAYVWYDYSEKHPTWQAFDPPPQR